MFANARFYVAAACFLLIIAMSVGLHESFRVQGHAIAPNIAAGLTGCGIAIAAGMALIGAAIVSSRGDDES